MIEAGKVDFLYTVAGKVSCTVVEHGWAVIATRRARTNGKDSGADGSVVYSLKSRQDIQNVTDFVDKKLGVGFILEAASYQSGYQLLAENSVYLLKDVGQFVIYGNDYERQYQDVLNGRIDGGFLGSTWIEQNHPDFLDHVRVHRRLYLSYEGEQYPLVTSTPLIPQYGLAASELIPWQLKHEVARALQRMDPSHPAAVLAKIAGFTGPATYAGILTTQKAMKIIISPEVGKSRCSNQWSTQEIFDSFACESIPGDYIKIPMDEALAKCNKTGHACPDGLLCFCIPCIPNPETNFFNWQLVLALCAAIYGVGILFALTLRPSLDPVGLVSGPPAAKLRKHRD